MSQFTPVFADSETPIEQLVASLGSAGWSAGTEEVSNIMAGQAIDGENWAPQLNPYEEWNTIKKQQPASNDDDWQSRWRLRICVDDDVRERLVAIGMENARKVVEQREQEKREREAALANVNLMAQVFGVKEAGRSCVLAKVDLRRYAALTEQDRDLVVVLPSHVGDVPVTRIDANAFSRYNVRGIGVRLLVVPDTVEVIDANSFTNIAAETIYIGAGCKHLGGQPVERRTLKPPIESRSFIVSADNSRWKSDQGNLVSKDGSELAFLAPPYEKRVAIPDGVRRIGADAFATWDFAPEVVECGYDLKRVASKLWDGALWLCPQDAPMFEVLSMRNVRLASHDVVTHDDCWYDFDDRGALLVAGPPAPPSPSQTFARAAASMNSASASGDSPSAMAKKVARSAPEAKALNVLRTVEGKPLVRIAPRALVTAPDTLILPEGLVEVGHDNACKGTSHLSLPQSLRRIEAHSFCSRNLDGITSIPAGVVSIGEGCFEYSVCRLEHTGTIVHISANQLLNCFIERSEEEVAGLAGAAPADYVPFNYARYDEMLCQGRSLPDRLGALVHRIATPFQLSDAAKNKIVSQLMEDVRDTMEYVAREGDRETVARLYEAGFINEDTFDEQIEMLRRMNRTDCVMLLMERHRSKGGQESSVRSRFAL